MVEGVNFWHIFWKRGEMALSVVNREDIKSFIAQETWMDFHALGLCRGTPEEVVDWFMKNHADTHAWIYLFPFPEITKYRVYTESGWEEYEICYSSS